MFFLSTGHVQSSKLEAPTAPALRQVTVWLDELAPHQGAFAHALEWALLLRLPLHAVAPVNKGLPCIAADALAACAATCEREGIAWRYSGEDLDKSSIMTASRPLENGFFVLGGALPRSLRTQWLRAASSLFVDGPLFCPPAWGSLRRAMVVNVNSMSSSQFLANAAAICRGAGCAVSVLTLSHSENKALRLQDSALRAFAGQRVVADFHTVVGSNARTAIAMVTEWCRCTHIFVERKRPSGLRRWLDTGIRNEFWELAERYAILPVADGPSLLAQHMQQISQERAAASDKRVSH
jgi:hypothetical protein